MLKELYTAAMGMIPQQKRLEVISNNMANSATTGFKRDSVFERNLIDAKANLYNTPGDAEDDDPPIGTYVDYTPGSMQQTFNPLDVSLENGGFFVTQDEEGKEFLTRDGHFRLSADGYITTDDGKFLMGDQGKLNVQQEFAGQNQLQKDKNILAEIKITPNGEVFVGMNSIGQLRVAAVDQTSTLQKLSASDFIVTDPNLIRYIGNENIKVRQGWLENSNVDIVKEMVQMIELQRMFEAGSKVITTNDTTLDNSIRLGRFS